MSSFVLREAAVSCFFSFLDHVDSVAFSLQSRFVVCFLNRFFGLFILAMHVHYQWPIKTPHSCIVYIASHLFYYTFDLGQVSTHLNRMTQPFLSTLFIHTRLPSQGQINSWSRILFRDLPSRLMLKILFTFKFER